MKQIIKLAAAAGVVVLASSAQAQTQTDMTTGTAQGGVPVAGEGAAPVTSATEAPATTGQTAAAPGADAAVAPNTVAASELTPTQFVQTATVSNTFEIQSSQLALERSQNEQIRQFAEQMIADHTAATERLTEAAQEDAVAVVQPYLDTRMQAMVDQLQAADEGNFDSQYVQMQIQAHEESIALFEAFAGREGALGTFAAETVPALREHLEMAQGLQQS